MLVEGIRLGTKIMQYGLDGMLAAHFVFADYKFIPR